MSERKRPEPWRGKTLANKVMSVAAGGAFGVLASVLLMFSGVGPSWILAVPIGIGLVLGFLLRDRGVRWMMRLIEMM